MSAYMVGGYYDKSLEGAYASCTTARQQHGQTLRLCQTAVHQQGFSGDIAGTITGQPQL
ncbi:MAG: hypothetical protein WCI66_09380 [Gammaproteobacteria bacterium]